jgi:hypothetical protein
MRISDPAPRLAMSLLADLVRISLTRSRDYSPVRYYP